MLTIGNFDGVHVGHQAILRLIVERARALGGESVLYTFEPHPRRVLQSEQSLRLLETFAQKMETLEAFGVDAVIAEPFDLAAYTKLNFGKNLYAAQFTVNEDYLAYDSTTLWGDLSYPTNQDAHKLRIAPVADVVAGTATWQRVACGTGAQISPQLGDGQRLVWLDTSLARTDVVTRASAAGTC